MIDDADEDDLILDSEPIAPSGQIDRWRRNGSVGAAVLSGFAMGLQEIFYPDQREEPAVVVEAGEPDSDRPVVADLDFEDPGASVVQVKRP
jgi:anti-sigma-K factor RskA